MTKEIVYTDKYALNLSDEKEFTEGWVLDGDNISEIIFTKDRGDGVLMCGLKGANLDNHYTTLRSFCKKIIAHLPLSDAPILDGVPLLPPLPQGDDDNWISDTTKDLVDTMIKETSKMCLKAGYNKAKEKYIEVINAIERLCDSSNPAHESIWRLCHSIQQPSRPTHFELKTITMNKGYTDESDFPYQEVELPKTITNSQGQIELVGKYITK